MSDPIQHECGIALVRLRQPLSYYREKYGTSMWGLDRLQLLMIKQRNRGQDGAGIACVKIGMPMGYPYLIRRRSGVPGDSSQIIFDQIHDEMIDIDNPEHDRLTDTQLKEKYDYLGEVYIGHLRYGTHGDDGISACHPHVRQSNWASRALALAGNFNLTNAPDIFQELVGYGLCPIGVSDTLTLLEKIGHFLDRENERWYQSFKTDRPDLEGAALAEEISRSLNVSKIMRNAARDWDGGYVLVGLIGSGEGFVARDPHGIRPAFYYVDDEVVAAASERAALTTVFNVEPDQVRTLQPGHVLSVSHMGEILEVPFTEPAELTSCSFERIYFSRGNDPDIYDERKALGRELAQRTLEAVDHDLDHAVFSFIPNTAETAFLGLIEELSRQASDRKHDEIWKQHEAGTLSQDSLRQLLNHAPRVEKAAHKDQKIRTFISQTKSRHDLVSHVYDITRQTVAEDDSLVILDDSIVRGTTLRESIITMLSRLQPKRIVIVSSAPPICYPDCYGIDMSELGLFVAFQAAVDITNERGQKDLLEDVYQACVEQADCSAGECKNHVQRIYDQISLDELSTGIAHRVRPKEVDWDGELIIVYQSIEGLRRAIPDHTGDWYFTGNYPTAGGYKVLNTAYINYHDHISGRSY